MFRNKVVATIFAVVLFLGGLFLLYTSNINKILLVDIYAENPLLIQEDKQLNGIEITKYNDSAYTLSLPATFLYQTKAINLQNTDNENIQIAFYSEQKKSGKKEIEFSLNVKNIQVNGQKFHTKKETVWNERPYIDSISVNKDETVSLTVKYKTKLMLRNMNLSQAAASIVLLLCSLLFVWKCWFWDQTRNAIDCIISFLEKKGEWDKYLIQKYRNIDDVYKKTFWTVFIILNLVFLYYNIHFIWGNHDWNYVLNGMWGKVSWFNGRFTNYLPYQLLGGRFLPILTVSLALFGYSFTGILLAYYWKIEKTFFNYLVISLVVVLNPLAIYWLYFSLDVVSHLWLPSIIILALILSEKKSIYYFILAYLLFIFGFGIYSSGIATIAVVFLGKIIINYAFENHSIKLLYQKFKQTFWCILLSLISFKIIIDVLIKLGKIEDSVYTNTDLFGGSLEQFLKIIEHSYGLLTRTVPFYDENLIYLLIGLSLFSIFALCWYQRKYRSIKSPQFCFTIAGICLLPLACNCVEFITGFNVFSGAARILFYGYIFLGTFFVALIFKTRFIWAKNILIVFLIFLLPMNVYRLYDAQKLWKIDFDYEYQLIEKIVEQIELSENYNAKQTYHVVLLSNNIKGVRDFYKESVDSWDYSFCNRDPFWPMIFPNFIKFHKPDFNIAACDLIVLVGNGKVYKNGSEVGEVNTVCDLLPYYDVLKNEMKEWPAKNSVLVKDNYIFINFDSKVLQGVLGKVNDIRREQGQIQ